MKTNELRIANWFIQYDEPEQFDGDFYHLSDIKFIPLTREWLFKFGFKLVFAGSGDGYLYSFGEKCNTMELINRGYGFKYNTFNSCEIEIKYVHQLQNLYFALTGEELKIQL